MDRPTQSSRPEARRRSPDRIAATAVLLCAASAALSGLSFALFARDETGLHPLLQPETLVESDFLSLRTTLFRTAASVQDNVATGVGKTVFLVLMAGALVGGVAFWSLVLTRYSQRKGELATRAALGAAPSEILREISAPLLRFAALGGVFGALLAAALTAVSLAGWPGEVETSYARAISKAGVAAVLCAVVLALVSVASLWLFVVRGPLADALRAGTRATGTLGERRVRELLTSLQVAACVTLLAVAVALADLPGRAAETGRGNAELWVASGELAGRGLSEDERSARLAALLRGDENMSPESIASAGAVLGAGFQEQLYSECDMCLRGYVPLPVTQVMVLMHSVGPGYFDLTGIRLVNGREFTSEDDAGATGAVIVNQAFVLDMFGSRNALGRAVRIGGAMGSLHRIVGVVENREGSALGSPDATFPAVYFAALQHPPVRFDLLRRTAPVTAMATSGLTAGAYVPLAEVEANAQAPLESTSRALRILALVCFLLGGYGVHATTIALVSVERRSLGIRMALGSTGFGLARYVTGYSARLVGVGIIIGAWLALGAQQVLEQILPSARVQPLAFLLAAALLTFTLLAGAARPVHRVLREQPANPLSD